MLVLRVLLFLFIIRGENFRTVDIEINALYSLFLNIEINLILYMHHEKLLNSTNRVYEADKFEILHAI